MKQLQSICLKHAHSNRSAIVCSDTGFCLTYAELSAAVLALSKELQSIGIVRKTPVILLLPTSIEFTISLFSVLSMGAIAAPVDRYSKGSSLIKLVDYMKPSALITNESLYRKLPYEILAKYLVITVNAHSDFTHKNIHVGIFNLSLTRTRKIIKYNSKDNINKLMINDSEAHLEDDALFITTSGTTGLPKIVRLSHRAVLTNIRMHMDSMEIDFPLIGIQTLEMNYSYGLIASFLSILYYQGTVILISCLDISVICKQIKEYEVNFWVGTPSWFRFIIDNINPSELESLQSLKKITIGGDNCSPSVREKIQQVFYTVEIYITYGATEAGPRVTTLPAKYILEKPTSVGLPLNGIEVRILNFPDNREKCAIGNVGQIAVQSPSLMSGYYGNPELSKKIFRDGWYLIGDLGRMDDGNFLYIMGRIDNQFKYRGRRTNPKLIEDCITSFPSIISANVSKEGEDGDDYIKATIVSDDYSLSLDELKRHCMKNLPMFMVPSRFHVGSYTHYYFKGKRVI